MDWNKDVLYCNSKTWLFSFSCNAVIFNTKDVYVCWFYDIC